MLSADDAEKLTIPLAMYITKDESVTEVNSIIPLNPECLTSHDDQYNRINDIIAKKPFASKNDSKNYENMYVSHTLPTFPEAHNMPPTQVPRVCGCPRKCKF